MKAMTLQQEIITEKLNLIVAMMGAQKKFKIENGQLTIWWRGWRFRIDSNFKVWPTAMRYEATKQEVDEYCTELVKAVLVAKDAETFAERGLNI